MTSSNRASSTQAKTPGTTPLYVYYIVGAVLIAFTLMNASTLGNPLIVMAVIAVIASCLYFISTPQGKAFVAKHSERHVGEQGKPASTVLDRTILVQELSAKGLLATNEKIVFNQWATYQCGVTGHPSASTSYGMAVVLNKSFAFYDKQLSAKIPYSRILEITLENFQVGAIRGALAAGAVALQLQQTRNILSIRYKDDKGIERDAKFQINGSLTIPGEADRAREVLNYLLEFKGDFANSSSVADPMARLEKLKSLKDQDAISEAEFQAKKSKLLEQM
jgi:Short C-terminal domain